MNFIEKDTWSEQDILDIIAAKTEENIHLDFKAAGALSKREGNQSPKAEITKDISAFANSDGGVIIYGLTEANHMAGQPDYIDGNEFTKEWLEQIISGGIQRNIPGLRIFPIRFGNDISKSMYVVSIPASPEAPHMNKDKKYYRRHDFQSVLMEEYEVRNLYGRPSLTNIEYFNTDLAIALPIDPNNTHYEIECRILIENKSQTVCELYKVLASIPPLQHLHITYNKENNYSFLFPGNDQLIITTNASIPVFPGEVFNALTFTVRVPKGPKYEEYAKELTHILVNILFGSKRNKQKVQIGDRLSEVIKKAFTPSLPPTKT